MYIAAKENVSVPEFETLSTKADNLWCIDKNILDDSYFYFYLK